MKSMKLEARNQEQIRNSKFETYRISDFYILVSSDLKGVQ